MSSPRRGAGVRRASTPCVVVRALTSSSTDVANSLATLKQAAVHKSMKPKEVFSALRQLEKANIQDSSWPRIIGGEGYPGRRWRLVFTTGTKQVQRALKGGDGGGQYFPLTAAQRWDASTGTIENGIYLGLLAALTFSGPYSYKGKKLSFDFDTLKIKIGPLKFQFPLKDKITSYEADRGDPFFIIFYVDEDIICARGRGGGIAFWRKCESDFDMRHLV